MIRSSVNTAKKYLFFFDTETTGLPKSWTAPPADVENWPYIVQIAWVIFDIEENIIKEQSYIVKPEGYTIPESASKIHRITNEKAKKDALYVDPNGITAIDFAIKRVEKRKASP